MEQSSRRCGDRPNTNVTLAELRKNAAGDRK
jgi:hypothetical protein